MTMIHKDERAVKLKHRFQGPGILGTRRCEVCESTSVDPDAATCASCGSAFEVPVVRAKTNNPVANNHKPRYHEARCVRCDGLHVAKIWISKPVCKPCWKERR